MLEDFCPSGCNTLLQAGEKAGIVSLTTDAQDTRCSPAATLGTEHTSSCTKLQSYEGTPLSSLSLDGMYWYVWIAAAHKKQISSFFPSSSQLEATVSKSVAPIKMEFSQWIFPVLYSEASRCIICLRPKIYGQALCYVLTLLSVIPGLAARASSQSHDTRASVQERSAAGSGRKSGAVCRAEYQLTGLCRCLYGSH